MRTQRTLTPIVLAVLLMAGCAKAPPHLSPSGQAAFHSIKVVKTLDLVRDIAISAEAQSPKVLSTEDTRKVVLWHRAAVQTIGTVPDGWKPTVTVAIAEVKRTLSPDALKQLGHYFTLLETVIAEVL